MLSKRKELLTKEQVKVAFAGKKISPFFPIPTHVNAPHNRESPLLGRVTTQEK
jgi:hypothetical protein